MPSSLYHIAGSILTCSSALAVDEACCGGPPDCCAITFTKIQLDFGTLASCFSALSGQTIFLPLSTGGRCPTYFNTFGSFILFGFHNEPGDTFTLYIEKTVSLEVKGTTASMPTCTMPTTITLLVNAGGSSCGSIGTNIGSVIATAIP